MKIFVLGSGALGTLLGARLSKKNEVILYSTNKNHMQEIRDNGLKIEELDGTVNTYDLKVVLDSEKINFAPDLVLVTLKTYSTYNGVKNIKDRLKGNPIYLTLQNGIGNVETLIELINRDRIIAGITAQGATFVKPGYIRHGGDGVTYIGEIDKDVTKRINDIVGIFNECRLKCFATNETTKLIWQKLLINIGINAITAIARARNGYIERSVHAREISKSAVSEAILIAKKLGLEFEENIFDVVLDVAKKTEKNISSMHQDILNKKKTEIDAINGAIVKYGEEFGIPTPVNKTLTGLIKLIEQKNLEEKNG
ncbi:2-dehydropantoate 2-reductase [Desulfothermus okinawensis JCM 13304]